MAKKFISETKILVILYAVDLLLIFLSLQLSYYFRFENFDIFTLELYALIAILWFNFFLSGTYNIKTRIIIWKELSKFLVALIMTILILSLLTFIFRKNIQGYWGRGVFLGTLTIFGILGSIYRFIFYRWLQSRVTLLRWLIVGSKKSIVNLMGDFKFQNTPGNLYFLSNDDLTSLDIDHRFILGKYTDLQTVTKNHWTAIIIAMDEPDLNDYSIELMDLRLRGIRLFDIATFYEYMWSKLPINHLSQTWFVFSQGFDLLHSNVNLRLKRVFDIVVSSLMLIFVAPVIGLTMLLIRLESKGSSLFKQTRTGKNGEPFTIYKLRSMKIDAESNGAQWAQKNDARITRVGKTARVLRVDELPQLWNVLRGDMSFIGPRPERPEFDAKLAEEIPFYMTRYLLRPGITGWAQVILAYGASVEDSREKLQHDLYYIKNHSLFLDLYVLMKTVKVVLGAKGR